MALSLHSASGEKLFALEAMGLASCWFLDPVSRICSHCTEQKSQDVLRGPEERNRSIIDVLGKKMNPGNSQSVQAR